MPKRDGVILYHGDCLTVLPTLPPTSVDALVTDPPAGIGFMGREWDSFDAGKTKGHRSSEKCLNDHGFTDGGNRLLTPTIGGHSVNATCRRCRRRERTWQGGPPACSCADPDFDPGRGATTARDAFIAFLSRVMGECLRVMKPGAFGLVWALPRTSHWTAAALEEAGFEIRDVIYHIFGCLSEDTEILVDGRWEPYQKIAQGQHALAYNRLTDSFEWQPIQEVFVYDYCDTAYRIVSDSTDQIVSRNHRCLVERGGGYAFQFAEEVARQRQARVPVLEDVQGLLEALPLPDERTSVASGAGAKTLPCADRGCSSQGPRPDKQCSCRPHAVCVQSGPQTIRASRFARSDLARIIPFHHCGKVWCIRVPSGAFVARRNGKVFITGNSGFPKSPSSLKPAVENWILVRKRGKLQPLGIDECRISLNGEPSPSVQRRQSHNHSETGTIDPDRWVDRRTVETYQRERPGERLGRWPANLCLSHHEDCVCLGDKRVRIGKNNGGAAGASRNGTMGDFAVPAKAFDYADQDGMETVEAWQCHPDCPVRLLDEQSGQSVSRARPANHEPCGKKGQSLNLSQWDKWHTSGEHYGDQGGASRFFATFRGENALFCSAKAIMEEWTTRNAIIVESGSSLSSGHVVSALSDAVTLASQGVTRLRDCRGLSTNVTVNELKTLCESVIILTLSSERRCWQELRQEKHFQRHDLANAAATLFLTGTTTTTINLSKLEDYVVAVTLTNTSESTEAGEADYQTRFRYCSKASRSDRGEGNNHPTVKSTKLMEWLVKLVCPPGGLVLDPFMGSGSTLVACLACGRQGVGIEMDEGYQRIAQCRCFGRTPA
jgi:DNA modification methylase